MSYAADAPGVVVVTSTMGLGDECGHTDARTGVDCHERGKYLAKLMFNHGSPAEVLVCEEHLAVQREQHPESVISCRTYRKALTDEQ